MATKTLDCNPFAEALEEVRTEQRQVQLLSTPSTFCKGGFRTVDETVGHRLRCTPVGDLHEEERAFIARIQREQNSDGGICLMPRSVFAIEEFEVQRRRDAVLVYTFWAVVFAGLGVLGWLVWRM